MCVDGLTEFVIGNPDDIVNQLDVNVDASTFNWLYSMLVTWILCADDVVPTNTEPNPTIDAGIGLDENLGPDAVHEIVNVTLG